MESYVLSLPYSPHIAAVGDPYGAARLYAGAGVAVFPVRGKEPLTPRGLLDATTDGTIIAGYWRRWTDAGVAIRTGDRVDVLDIDTGKGGLSTLARLEALHGTLPATWRVSTGGGGWHLYMAHWPGLRNSVGRIGPGLDVRATGGYVVAPPSLHPSGRRYEWIVPPGAVPLAPWPAWLAALAMAPATQLVPAAAPCPAGSQPIPPGLRRFAEAGAPAGERNARGFWLSCRLVQECGDTREARDLLDTFGAACRPPLDAREVARLWSSARQHQLFAPRVHVRGARRLPVPTRPASIPLPSPARPASVLLEVAR